MVPTCIHFRMIQPGICLLKYKITRNAYNKSIIPLANYKFPFQYMTPNFFNQILHTQCTETSKTGANNILKEYETFVKQQGLNKGILWKESTNDTHAYFIVENQHMF